MFRDHRMPVRPVAVVAFTLALASPAVAADYIPDEGCGFGCNGRAQGYAFAESNNISDPYACEGRGHEFFAGCVAFVEQQGSRRVWIAPQPQPYNGLAKPTYGGGYAAPGYNAGPDYSQGYEPPPPDGEDYAAPGNDQNDGYASPGDQYDEPQEQGDGGSGIY